MADAAIPTPPARLPVVVRSPWLAAVPAVLAVQTAQPGHDAPPLGAQGAQQLVGAALADPGRGRHLAGMQAGAGGALGGDPGSRTRVRLSGCGRLPLPVVAVWSGAASCGGPAGIAVVTRSPLRSSMAVVGPVCGRPVRATLISSSNAHSSATGGRAANSCALSRSGACATLRATVTAVAQATRVQAYQGDRQPSPRRYRYRITRDAAAVKLSTRSGADQANSRHLPA
jgi:hypothetical protein